MELQDQLKSDWHQYFCNQPPVEFNSNENRHPLCSELRSSFVRMEGSSDPYSSIWTDAEQVRVKNCNNRSFAMDARIRLDSLKSGYNTALPCRAMDGLLHSYNDPWDSDESQEEESALDLVELLDVEDNVQDEENWLYESPKKQVFMGRSESALRWCRHVLDNPSPEIEAACRSLINRLEQSSSSHFYRQAVFHHTVNVSVGSSMDKISVSTTQNTSDSKDNTELSISRDITTSYRLQDITDVHIMARLQEASLRQDYVSTPATASSRRSTESPVTFTSYFNTYVENTDDIAPGSKTEPSSSSWQPGLSSQSSSFCQSPPSVAKQGCQSPKLSRLHQQVTQFKLLKLAQNQATSSGRTRSPLRTSLRSLQAVRNSRSLETDDHQLADSQISHPLSGAPSVRRGSSCWSPSLSAASMNSSGTLHSVRDSLDRVAIVKRLQRSQSVSPCRIPHPAKGHLSVNGRVFASPERSATVAWARNAPSTQR
uniref:SLAIN motif-containing protein-like n=1 Tax=Scatophagus argus TaxID=75038 RepID=UPI001ED8440F|nr:SLAIN motif-containing protein-like [Scatophagus argus]